MSDGSIEPLDLDDCSREPIRTPGGIQPHGYLFILNETDLTLIAASENAAEALRLPPSALIGRPITDFLVSMSIESLETAFEPRYGGATIRAEVQLATQPVKLCALVHRSNGLLLLELAPIPPDRPETLFDGVRFAISRIRHSVSLEAGCEALATEIRRLTDFDRVMVYRFDPEWNGEVVAEDRAPGAGSYLGYLFPASDIPIQARELYLRHTIRMIPDARCAPSPIFPKLLSSTGSPFDMSCLMVRAVSPVHLKYLANMGVIASMSVSIVRNGRLWGLVACHHFNPRLLDYRALQGCDLIADAFAGFLDARQGVTTAECLVSVRRLEAVLSQRAADEGDCRDQLTAIAPALLDLVSSRGLAICDGSRVWAVGEVPANHQILALVRWLGRKDDKATGDKFADGELADRGQFITDHLCARFPSAERYSALASGIAARQLGNEWLICFRPEWRHTLTWAGDPDKVSVNGPDGGRINPRTSFAAWHEQARGRSRPWTVPDKFAVDQLQTLVARAMMDDHARWAQERSKLKIVGQVAGGMAHELNSLLQPIVGMAQMAAEDHQGDAELTEAFAIILDSAGRAAEIVSGLLLCVRSSPKGSRRAWLAETVTSHVDALRPGLPPEIHFDLQIATPSVRVRVDHDELGQIILNLTDNAIHAMGGRGQLTITVAEFAVSDSEAARLRVSPGRYGCLTFHDNGPGIPFAQLEHVFEPFFTTKELGQGMGLGLSVARGIVRSWGGGISARNPVEGGAALTILLPVEDPGEAGECGGSER